MTPHRAAAQTSDAALAESLFIEGRKLITAGEVAAACPKFRQSHELDPQLGTLLNLAMCYERNGQTASAWAAFTELSRLASRAGQKARADFAAERIQALEPDLAYVTLRVLPPPPWSQPETTLDPSPWWPAAIAGYAVTGVGLVVGGITGGFALDIGGSLECPMDACTPADADDLSRATTLANAANVSFAVAGASAIFGIVATVIAVNDEKVELSSRGMIFRF